MDFSFELWMISADAPDDEKKLDKAAADGDKKPDPKPAAPVSSLTNIACSNPLSFSGR